MRGIHGDLPRAAAACAALLLGGLRAHGMETPSANGITAIPGFRVDKIYTVPKEEGSWVALTLDGKGRLITSDQYGGLFRVTLPAPDEKSVGRVDRLDTRGIGGAQGLLSTNGSLYVMVNQVTANKFGDHRPGLYRLTGTASDGRFDRVEFLREIDGTGEHGVHQLLLGPDGRTIYYTDGNASKLPVHLEASIPVAWSEDMIVPRMWPPVGIGRGFLAPSGIVARTDLTGTRHELFAIGLRNAYRMAFDPNGELFTSDSDPENDMGAPFYVPTRLIHLVSGGEYGFRSGSGRWPPYYCDSLPAILNTGPGSPTGLAFGTGARFPARYQTALFVEDWTFGTLYAMHLIPDGATFRAVKEEFLSGRALPLNDMLIDPNDGAMYFTTGGRLTDSGLYRVRYVGTEKTAPVPYPAPTAEALVRRKIESLQESRDPAVVDQVWPYLSNPDRFVRWAARIVLELQPVGGWTERALAESDPQGSLEALLALVRLGDRSLQPRIIDALNSHALSLLPVDRQLSVLRLWELTFTRMGAPSAAVKARALALLDSAFPSSDRFVNRELVGLLTYLDSPTVVEKAVPLLKVAEPPNDDDAADVSLLSRNELYGTRVSRMNAASPDRQQFAYAFALRSARRGWTPELRKAYFGWFQKAYAWSGGLGFQGYLDNTRRIALAAVPSPTERAYLTTLSARPPPTYMIATRPPKGPGRAYTLDEAVSLVRGHLTGRDFEQGSAMFIASACVICHQIGTLSHGTIGPDLTHAGNRFSEHDLLQAIIEPSAKINESDAPTRYEMADGSALVGYPAFEENDELYILTNPMVPGDLTALKSSDVRSSRPSETSLMPKGLINALNPDELRDLVAFVLSGGSRSSPMFRPLSAPDGP